MCVSITTCIFPYCGWGVLGLAVILSIIVGLHSYFSYSSLSRITTGIILVLIIAGLSSVVLEPNTEDCPDIKEECLATAEAKCAVSGTSTVDTSSKCKDLLDSENASSIESDGYRITENRIYCSTD